MIRFNTFLFMIAMLVALCAAAAAEFVLDFAPYDVPATEPSPAAAIELVLDRRVYDLRDSKGIAIVRTRPGSKPVDDLSIRVTMTRDGVVLENRVLPGPPAAGTELLLDIGSLEPGATEVAVALLFRDRAIAESTQTLRKEKRELLPLAAEQGRVEIIVPPVPGAAGCKWPVNVAAAFAQGSVDSIHRIRLVDAGGRELAVQKEIRALWHRDGSIRWLGIEFIATVGDNPKQYYLEYGPEVEPEALTTKLRCYETDDGVSVTTGPLLVAMTRKDFRLIETAFFDADETGTFVPREQVIRESEHAGFFVIDHDGDRYEPAHDHNTEITVEVDGPVRATIRVQAWYVKIDTMGQDIASRLPTEALLRLDLRLHAYAGLPLLRLEIVNIVTVDTKAVQIRALGFAIAPDKPRAIDLGRLRGTDPIHWDKAALAGPQRIVHRPPIGQPANGAARPLRLAGWVDVSGRKAVMMVAMPGFQNLYPKDFSWDNKALQVYIWPDNWPTPISLGDGRVPWSFGLGSTLSLSPRPDEGVADDPANGHGTAISNDVYIAFRALEGQPQWTREQFVRLLEEPPAAHMSPKSLFATGVLGPVLHRTDDFAVIEANMRARFDYLAAKSGGFESMLLYGAHKPGDDRATWQNGRDGLATYAFLDYLRTGDSARLRWAQDHANYVLNFATCHYVSKDLKFPAHVLGGRSKGEHALPWGNPVTVAGADIEFLVYDYFITGNPRAAAAAETWLETFLNPDTKIDDADPGHVFRQLLAIYQWKWDARVLDRMSRLLPGNESAIAPEVLVQYYLLTGDETALAHQPDALAIRAVQALRQDDREAAETLVATITAENFESMASWATFLPTARQYPYVLKAMHSFGIELVAPAEVAP